MDAKKLLILLVFLVAIAGIIAPVSATIDSADNNKVANIESKEKSATNNIIWNANGGMIGSKKTVSNDVKKNSKIGKFLTKPKRSGYTLKGWYTKKTGGTKISVNTKPTKSATYYAHWTKSIMKKAVIETKKGNIELELFDKDAPKTVANFEKLAKKGFYNGLTFHRVIENFVIQGGCPRGDGYGGPGYTIKCEINKNKHGTGALSMAHAGKNTGGSQFFITLSPQPHLDGVHTVFGKVISGMDVVKSIKQGDVMEKVTVTG